MAKPIILIAALLACATVGASASRSPSAPHPLAVLDGDTVVVDGSPFRVAGIDAPELGPWARCWAEAALAGHSRDNLQTLLGDSDGRGWHLIDVSQPDAEGRRTARIVDRNGYDIADDMVVYGYAARTSGRWNWCGEKAGLRQVLEGEQPPHGPNLWWPTAHMFDPRAAD